MTNRSPLRPTPHRDAHSFPSTIEALESRIVLATIFVVPPTQPADATHVYTLSAALPLAGAAGTVIIDAGAVADPGTVTVTLDDITIQGASGVAPGSLSMYDLNINSDRVTLANLNLGLVTLTATADHITLTGSKLLNFTETGTTSGAGGNILRYNEISGAIDLQGNSGAGEITADLVEHNKFVSLSPVVVKLTNANGTMVRHNEIVDPTSSAVGIQVRSNSDNVTIEGNKVTLSGAGQPIGVALINTGGAAGNLLSARVLNNEVFAGPAGTGMLINIFGTGAGLIAQIEGNEFAGNKVGVDVNGIPGATGSGNVDLGGGASAFGSSKGGNNFRGFTGINGNFAIYLHNTDANVGVFAQKNIYTNGVTPGTVNRDKNNGAGTGVIDATSPLDANHGYVQSLFTQLLGRVADPAQDGELDQMVAVLAKSGRVAVSKAILFGTESLGRMVGDLFEKYPDRAPTELEKARYSKILKSGNIAAAEAGILGSAEYRARINADVVQSLYRDLLDRSATIAELTEKSRASAKSVATSLAKSAERRADFVSDLYRNFLHRPGTDLEVTTAAKKPGQLLKLTLNMITSDDFFNNG